MAKRKVNTNGHSRITPETLAAAGPNRNFVTKAGVELTLVPIPPMLLEKVRGSVKYPPIPQYETKTAAGNIEKFNHDESTLQTDADKAAWAEYTAAKREADRLLNERVMRALFLKGIALDMPADDEWIKEQEFMGIEIPTDPQERKLHYIQTEILASSEDMVGIMSDIMRLTGVEEAVVQSAEDSFRRAVEDRRRVASARVANSGGELVPQ